MSSSRRSAWAFGVLDPAGQFPQGDAGGVADDLAGPGSQHGQLGDQVSRGVLDEAGPEVLGASEDKGSGLVDGGDPLTSGRALGDNEDPDRLDAAVAAPRDATGPPGLGGAGCADGVEGVGLA